MSKLRSTIESLSSQFAASIIEALRGASIEELFAVAHGGGGGARRGRGRPAGAASAPMTTAPRRRGKGGRLARRTADDIGQMVDAIVDLLGKTPNGLRAEQIRSALGVESKELPRPLAEAVSAGKITKQGQKRATTYFAGSGGGASPRRGRRAQKK
jgi:hypothetical protein